MRRDISERGRDVNGVLKQYLRFVKPSFDDYIYPTIKFAHVIIPRGLENTPAIDLITKHIIRQLTRRGNESILKQLASGSLPPNVALLPETAQLKYIHTIVRNIETRRDDFIFFTDRLSRLVAEFALAQIAYMDCDIETPTNSIYKGSSPIDKLCGVAIVRAGSSMEHGLSSVIKDIALGKILIDIPDNSSQPILHYYKLPRDISKRHVFIADAEIATGSVALMAIQVALEQGVPEDKITFLTLIASPAGIASISHAYPQVKIVVSAIDRELSSDNQILPGFGKFAGA